MDYIFTVRFDGTAQKGLHSFLAFFSEVASSQIFPHYFEGQKYVKT